MNRKLKTKIYFTCGPSQLYPTVKKHLKEAMDSDILSISHRSPQFQKIYQSLINNLKKLLNLPEDFHIFFLSSSLESIERIIQNCVAKYSFHFVNGAFSKKFYQAAIDLKKNPQLYEVGGGYGFDLKKVEIPKKTEVICLTHNETSAGLAIPLKLIDQLRVLTPSALIAVDVVSSAPYPSLDYKKIDLAFFSTQKAFGLPAGLSVLLVNEKALNKVRFLEKKGFITGSYHRFISLLKKEQIFQTPETPNVLAIYLLNKVCQDMLRKGIQTIRKETEEKATMLYNFFDNHSKWRPYVKDLQFRSKTTIVIDVKEKAKEIVSKLASWGFILSLGYGSFKDSQIRISNFPAHSINDVKKLIKSMELL